MPHYLVRWQFKDTTAIFVERPQDRTGLPQHRSRASAANCTATTLLSVNMTGWASASSPMLNCRGVLDKGFVVGLFCEVRNHGAAHCTRGRSRDEARTINECELPGAGHLGLSGASARTTTANCACPSGRARLVGRVTAAIS